MCYVRKLFGVLVLMFVVVQVGATQDQIEADLITNADVIEMIEAGLSAGLVLATFESCGCDFQTSPSDLITLVQAGVPDHVVQAMVTAGNETESATPPPAGFSPDQIDPVVFRPIADPISFPKTKYVVQDGDKNKEINADLILNGVSMIVKERKDPYFRAVFVTIPFADIEQIVYERSTHARIKTAILLSPLALFSRGKKHWLTITYRVGDRSEFVLLKLDKKEQQRIIASVEAQTGIDVERIIDD